MLKPLLMSAAIARYPPQPYGDPTAPANSIALPKKPLRGGTPASPRNRMAMLSEVCGIRRLRPLNESRLVTDKCVATAAAAINAAVLRIE